MGSDDIQSQDITDLGVNVNGEQFLSFRLSDEEYAVDILRVQEIKGWERATPIPNTPDYVRGVINLRGTVVPIVDLRRRFQLANAEDTATTVVIVLKVQAKDSSERTMGFVVDAVADVYKVPCEQLQSPPDFGEHVHAEFVRGLATLDEKMVILLDVDNLVETDGAFGESHSATH